MKVLIVASFLFLGACGYTVNREDQEQVNSTKIELLTNTVNDLKANVEIAKERVEIANQRAENAEKIAVQAQSQMLENYKLLETKLDKYFVSTKSK